MSKRKNKEDYLKRGAPSKYGKITDEKVFLEVVAALKKAKYTDDKIAEFLGVTPGTFKNWKKKFPDFLATVKSSNDEVICRLEDSLNRSAYGYEVVEVDGTPELDENGNIKKVLPVRAKKRHVPANPATLIFNLVNRTKHRAKDGSEGMIWEHIQRIDATIKKEEHELTEEEIDKEIAETAKKLGLKPIDK